MEKILEKLIDAYADEMNFYAHSYEMMCKMLDINCLEGRLRLLKADEIYIYGGGYLGIQFYRMAYGRIGILAVVDKSGRLRLELPDIPVINTSELREKYSGQKIIVTSVRFYQEIREQLSDFVPQSHIIYLGELLEGILG